MEIINKKSEVFRKAKLESEGCFVTFSLTKSRASIYFSIAACLLLGIDSSMRVHLATEFDRVYFFFNTEATGFRLWGDTYKHGLSTTCQPMMAILKKQYPTKIKHRHKFKVRESITRINDSLTIEVLLNKRA